MDSGVKNEWAHQPPPEVYSSPRHWWQRAVQGIGRIYASQYLLFHCSKSKALSKTKALEKNTRTKPINRRQVSCCAVAVKKQRVTTPTSRGLFEDYSVNPAKLSGTSLAHKKCIVHVTNHDFIRAAMLSNGPMPDLKHRNFTLNRHINSALSALFETLLVSTIWKWLK